MTRLTQAPTTLPTDQGLVDEHDVQADTDAENTDATKGITKDSATSTERSASSSPVQVEDMPVTQTTDFRPTLDVKPEGLIRFRSTIAVEGEIRPPSDLHAAEEERLTKRAKEIHGTLPT